jgi:hypothetical protein
LDIDQRTFIVPPPAWRRYSLLAHISQQENVMGNSLPRTAETNDLGIRCVTLPDDSDCLAHPGENVMVERGQAALAESPYA